MTAEQLDIGGALRDQALADVRARTDNTWRLTALNGVRELARRGEVFEAYDLVLLGVPEPEHSSRWGALFNTAARAGIITAAGAGPSARPTVKKSLTRFWRGTDLSRRSASAPCPDCAGPVVRTNPIGRPPMYCAPCGARRAHQGGRRG